MLTLAKAASMATTNVPVASHEVVSFNFRHSIGRSFGLHARCEHEGLSAVVIPLGIEHRFQRADIIASSLESRGTHRPRRAYRLAHSSTRDEKRGQCTASALPSPATRRGSELYLGRFVWQRNLRWSE